MFSLTFVAQIMWEWKTYYGNMLWIEEIAESKPAPQFLTNSRIDIAGFVNPHKVVVSDNAFLVVQVHKNTGEFEEFFSF